MQNSTRDCENSRPWVTNFIGGASESNATELPYGVIVVCVSIACINVGENPMADAALVAA